MGTENNTDTFCLEFINVNLLFGNMMAVWSGKHDFCDIRIEQPKSFNAFEGRYVQVPAKVLSQKFFTCSTYPQYINKDFALIQLLNASPDKEALGDLVDLLGIRRAIGGVSAAKMLENLQTLVFELRSPCEMKRTSHYLLNTNAA